MKSEKADLRDDGQRPNGRPGRRVHCYLSEYLALKRVPLLRPDGDKGTLVAMRFREPDWKVVSISADFGMLTRFVPEQLEWSMAETPVIRVLHGPQAAQLEADGSTEFNALDADELLGCRIVSSGDDAVGGLIRDLLINLRYWRLKYFVVDNGERRVLLHAAWVTGLSRDAASVLIDGLPACALQSAPEYPGVAALTPGFEDTVYRHYTHRDFVSDAD